MRSPVKFTYKLLSFSRVNFWWDLVVSIFQADMLEWQWYPKYPSTSKSPKRQICNIETTSFITIVIIIEQNHYRTNLEYEITPETVALTLQGMVTWLSTLKSLKFFHVEKFWTYYFFYRTLWCNIIMCMLHGGKQILLFGVIFLNAYKISQFCFRFEPSLCLAHIFK